MALDNYGRIMGGAAEFAMLPYATYQGARQDAQLQQRRDAIVQNDAAQVQFEQQKYAQQQQQADAEDAAWEQAYSTKDWGAMARIDPQTTKILWDVEQSKNPQAQQVGSVVKLADGTYASPSQAVGKPFYQEPQQGGDVGLPSGVRENIWFMSLPPEKKAEVLNYRRGNSSPEITQANASARALGTAQGERSALIEKKIADAANVGNVLDMAVPLIHQATGSGVGAQTDRIAGFFGVPLEGAEATAALKMLEANLVLTMPRMEGPQSNLDQQLYREAAGQIGDPSVPRSIKLNAVRTLNRLNARYVKTNAPKVSAPAQAAPAPAGVMQFDNQGNPK